MVKQILVLVVIRNILQCGLLSSDGIYVLATDETKRVISYDIIKILLTNRFI